MSSVKPIIRPTVMKMISICRKLKVTANTPPSRKRTPPVTTSYNFV